MKSNNSKQLIWGNAALWLFAILAHPVSQALPTGSGEPPKIFTLLIPIILILCGYASTLFMMAALRSGPDREM